MFVWTRIFVSFIHQGRSISFQTCIHLRLPIFQVLTEEQKRNLKYGSSGEGDTKRQKNMMNIVNTNTADRSSSQATKIVNECLQIFIENIKFPPISFESESECRSGTSSLFTLKYKKRSVSFCDTVDCVSRSQSHSSANSSEVCAPNSIEESTPNYSFGAKETAVYMTLFDDYCRPRCSGTQATAFINKCMQVSDVGNNANHKFNNLHQNSNFLSSVSSVSKCSKRSNLKGKNLSNTYNKDVFFFEKKKKAVSGMGHNKRKQPTIEKSTTGTTTDKRAGTRGCSTGTGTKAVCIKDDKEVKEETKTCDMVATVSHIRIGPKTCPGICRPRPCAGSGMKCIVANQQGEEAPVKVSNVINPRRGVFELVIRRMTGAPLAKNELMLEWTPPPCRPCGSTCPIPVWCPPGPCPPSKCKMVICRPSSCRIKCSRSKCCKKGKPCGPIPCPVPCSTVCSVSCGVPCRSGPCGVPCRTKPCGPIACRKCRKPSCCGKPCRSCKPCPPFPRCTPCPPSPCGPVPCAQPCNPCSSLPCGVPCRSSPCLRLCPVGRRKPRRCRSQPRIRDHRKRISPCCNREHYCPVVRCRSVPGPCSTCCGFPPFCPPRKCRSIFPFKPRCCKSGCSTCCG